MILKSDVKFEQKPICFFEKDNNLVNFDLSTQVSNICTVICPFCAKYVTFDQKNYRGVIFDDTEDSCKIWRKTGLWFGKWHKAFGKFSAEHLKVSKLILSWDHFVQSRKWMSQKFTEKLCVMTLKNYEKCKEDWLVVSKLKFHKQFDEFWLEHWKVQKCTLQWAAFN